MRFLVDEDVPQEAVEYLRQRGHTVLLSRDLLAPATPDEVVAKLADDEAAILVTCNAKDFKALLAKIPPGGRQAYRFASRITLETVRARGPSGVSPS